MLAGLSALTSVGVKAFLTFLLPKVGLLETTECQPSFITGPRATLAPAESDRTPFRLNEKTMQVLSGIFIDMMGNQTFVSAYSL
jgi:hypothetical protein